jgi:hypothetical protein
MPIMATNWNEIVAGLGGTAREYVERYGGFHSDSGMSKVLENHGFVASKDSVYRLKKKLGIKSSPKPTEHSDPPSSGETHEIAGNNWTITVPKTRIHTLDQLLEFFQVDTKIWEVEKFVVNKWEVGAMPHSVGGGTDWSREHSDFVVEPLYQVKAWLKKKVVVVAILDEIAAMKEDAKSVRHKWTEIKRSGTPSGNMLELTIPDLHIGKLAWGKETGWGDYDTKIADEVFRDAVNVLLRRSKVYRPQEIVMVIGNDLLHTDNLEGSTTLGTPQSSDSRYHKVFRAARVMLTDTIDYLRKSAPVRVLVIPGNHDQLGAWHMGDSLDSWYHTCKDVIVDNEPTQRKYYQWGNVMLMWTHGDKGKRADYPILMATEQPGMFGETVYREAHIGDRHQVRLEENHGVRVRILPSLSEPDDWHAERGFVGNTRSAEAYVWNRSQGLIGTAVFSVPELDERRSRLLS